MHYAAAAEAFAGKSLPGRSDAPCLRSVPLKTKAWRRCVPRFAQAETRCVHLSVARHGSALHGRMLCLRWGMCRRRTEYRGAWTKFCCIRFSARCFFCSFYSLFCIFPPSARRRCCPGGCKPFFPLCGIKHTRRCLPMAAPRLRQGLPAARFSAGSALWRLFCRKRYFCLRR